MSDLRFHYAGGDYWDRTLGLIDGTVKPDGVDLHYETGPLNDIFRRMVQEEAYDASEMALSTLISLISRGDRRFVALPVFPSRAFRHGYVFVSKASGIAAPSDLRGRTVGLPEYDMTSALWIRGFLQHDYGVGPGDVKWRLGGLRTPGYRARTTLDLPAGIELERIPEDKSLEGMLDKGDLDALITPFRPPSFIRNEGKVERLFKASRPVELAYYYRSRLFPIMHAVVVRRAVLEAAPWLGGALTEAFDKAREAGLERLRTTGQAAVGLPWLADELEEADAIFSAGDPYASGRAANEDVLAAACRYSFEQGLSPRLVSVDELFGA